MRITQKRPYFPAAHSALPVNSGTLRGTVPSPVLIAGATGRVGETMIRLLEERGFPVERLIPVASARSAGKTVVFRGKDIPIITLEQALLTAPGIALFAAGGAVSKTWAPLYVEKGWRVIDNSSYWRMNEHVPLIVPEINGHLLQPSLLSQPSDLSQPSHLLQPSDRLIANPNCSTIQMVMVLAPLHKAFGLQRVVAATYQSVSGSGRKGEAQLERERAQAERENAQLERERKCAQAQRTQPELEHTQTCRQSNNYHTNPASPYPCPIDLNVIPQIGDFLEDGYSEEERKMMDETKKIFNDLSIGVSATTVRVPVYGAHCVSLNVQLARPFTLEEVRRLLSSFPGLVLTDAGYATPLTAKGTDAVYVSRVRRDSSTENGLELWTVADNIRKGAALNAVQIAETLLTLKGSE